MTLSPERLAEYRARLEEIAAEAATDSDTAAEARSTVTLDQQSVGRLSRMDAIQGQAMARAGRARRRALGARAAAALARMEEGEFGYCTDCGEEIPEGRLDFDPTLAMCVSCARG